MLNLKFYKSLIGDSKSWKPNFAQPTLGALTGIPIPFLNLEFERQNLCSLMRGNYSEIVLDTYSGCAARALYKLHAFTAPSTAQDVAEGLKNEMKVNAISKERPYVCLRM